MYPPRTTLTNQFLMQKAESSKHFHEKLLELTYRLPALAIQLRVATYFKLMIHHLH